MKVRIVQNSRIPKYLGVKGITLYPFILLSGTLSEAYEARELQHEYIHVLQVRQLGIARFYVTYLAKFMIGLLKYGNWNEAYHSIDFEAAAYRLQSEVLIPTLYLKGKSWYLN